MKGVKGNTLITFLIFIFLDNLNEDLFQEIYPISGKNVHITDVSREPLLLFFLRKYLIKLWRCTHDMSQHYQCYAFLTRVLSLISRNKEHPPAF